MKSPAKGMTFAQVVKKAREIAWKAYLDGPGFTCGCETPEEMLVALEKIKNPAKTQKTTVASIGRVPA